jgi:hypothetical protein
MARLSHGPRRATAWTTAPQSRPMPRVVRLGRPANDNARSSAMLIRAFAFGLAVSLLAFVAWQMI